MRQDMIVVLDLGSTRNTDVARAIRALGVYSEICNYDVTIEEIYKLPNVKGIVANGGPNDVVDGEKIGLSEAIVKSGLPIYTFDYEWNGILNPMQKKIKPFKKLYVTLFLILAKPKPIGTWIISSLTKLI